MFSCGVCYKTKHQLPREGQTLGVCVSTAESWRPTIYILQPDRNVSLLDHPASLLGRPPILLLGYEFQCLNTKQQLFFSISSFLIECIFLYFSILPLGGMMRQ